MGYYSNGQNTSALGERTKVSVDKNNFNSALADLNPKAKISVENTLAGNRSELPVDLDFKSMDALSDEL
jgi:type VI secretion system protein ImpB